MARKTPSIPDSETGNLASDLGAPVATKTLIKTVASTPPAPRPRDFVNFAAQVDAPAPSFAAVRAGKDAVRAVQGSNPFRAVPHKASVKPGPHRPKPGKNSAMLVAGGSQKVKVKVAPQNKLWTKLGVQPDERGYTLHIEQYEGDKLIKASVRKNLSALAAREAIALHLAGVYARF